MVHKEDRKDGGVSRLAGNSRILHEGASQSNAQEKDDSDDSLNWEDFFGTSVDITSALLDMFDTIVAKSKSKVDGEENGVADEDEHSFSNDVISQEPSQNSIRCPGGGDCRTKFLEKGKEKRSAKGMCPDVNKTPATASPVVDGRSYCGRGSTFPKRNYSLSESTPLSSCLEKRRPLSTSSVSSSSSSSSSSLPRNGLDVKKSYLASIESLDDDELSDNGRIGLSDTPPRRNSTTSVSSVPGATDGCTSRVNGSPVSPPSSVCTPCRPKYCDPNLSPIDRVIVEIVETERTYVRDLQEIIQGYLRHISRKTDSKISQELLVELFGNIEDIYRFNSKFLTELEQCGLDAVAIARCFVQNSTGFPIYTQYCTNYPGTVSVLTELMRNSETAEVFKERQISLHHTLPLGSYLLKPVQRILKYHLLLQNIVKYYDKDGEGYADIKNALSVMTGIAYHINDMKRKHEHAVRVQEIQSLLYGWVGQDLTTYGELVAEGAFRMLTAKALRHLFLFDKMLLIAKKKEEGILSYKTHIMCSNLMLIESIQGEPLWFHVIPFDNPRLQYTFQARNLEQKREWCQQLKRVILENYNAVIPSHARQLVMELGQSKTDDGVLVEKSSSRRQFSAPEYLERRKQERRKSEITLNKTFKIKRGSSKKCPMVERRTSRSRSASHDETSKSRDSSAQRKDDDDDDYVTVEGLGIPINPICGHQRILGGDEKSCIKCSQCTSSSEDSHSSHPQVPTDSETGTALATNKCSCNNANSQNMRCQTSLSSGHSHEDKNLVKDRRTKVPLKSWVNMPEETTDTENEDLIERLDVQRLLQYRPPPRTFRSRHSTSSKQQEDPSGEYVTFYFANSHATRDTKEPEQIIMPSSSKSSETSTPVVTSDVKSKEDAALANYDNLLSLWATLGTVQLKQSEPSQPVAQNDTKRHTPVRRVHSFTETAKEKVSAIHQTFSFRRASNMESLNHGAPPLPPKGIRRPTTLSLGPPPPLPTGNSEELSPTAPEMWLKQQQHFVGTCKKGGSLPRTFESSCSPAATNILNNKRKYEQRKLWLRCEGNGFQNGDPRPFTIAADKPFQVDLVDDLEQYIEDSPAKQSSYRFPVGKDESDEQDITTSCTTTPAISMENVSVHPEHRIYRQGVSRYATLKTVLSTVGSKLAGLRATLSSPLPPDHADTCSTVSFDSDSSTKAIIVRDGSASRASVKSEREVSPRILTAKLVHSVAKAYTSMIKQKLKKEESSKETEIISSPMLPRVSTPFHQQGSPAIGARMAKPFESEYCVPKFHFISRMPKGRDQEVRPDSVLSESSNVTSSSDGEKNLQERIGSGSNGVATNMLPEPVRVEPSSAPMDDDDSPSDASDASVDSYYERTFEEIENALSEDMFRDSAIYSDPEDVDLGAVDLLPYNRDESFNMEQKNQDDSLDTSSGMDATDSFVHQSDNAELTEITCVKHVKSAIIEKLKILEESSKFRKDEATSSSAIEIGLKSIHQRRQELERWCSSNTSSAEPEAGSESGSENSVSTVKMVVTETNETKSQPSAPTNPNPQPHMKGWVKHVVNKLQSEGQV